MRIIKVKNKLILSLSLEELDYYENEEGFAISPYMGIHELKSEPMLDSIPDYEPDNFLEERYENQYFAQDE